MAVDLWQGRWRGRAPAGDTHERARNVIAPTGGIVRGKFPSRKNGRSLHYEGLLEQEAMYLFELAPRIVRCREQPRRIPYPDQATLRTYTPDVELLLSDGSSVLVEVKPVDRLATPEVAHGLAAVRQQLERNGERFVVLTDADIRREPRLTNAKWVFHQVPRRSPTAAVMAVAAARLRPCFPTSIRHAAELLLPVGADPFSFLMAGLAVCDFEEQLTLDSAIDLACGDDHDWFCVADRLGF